MKIKSTHPESQGEFVEINDADFDPKTMTKYEELTKSETKRVEAQKKAKVAE